MVPAVTRFARTKTALVLATAGAVIAAAALLAPRRAGPGAATAEAGGVSLDARARSRTVLRGESETDLAITIRAPRAVRESARPRISLAVVLDVSGSMAGARIDDAKAAARHVIDELGDSDRFALISFSTRAELLLPMTDATADAKQRATAAIAGLRADGDTNMSEALAVGAQALAAGGDADRLRRIVLISDGKPENAGITDLNNDVAARSGQKINVALHLQRLNVSRRLPRDRSDRQAHHENDSSESSHFAFPFNFDWYSGYAVCAPPNAASTGM